MNVIKSVNCILAQPYFRNWKRVNTEPVCFGARDNSHGIFNITESGSIYTFKLVHRSGSLSCIPTAPASNWGCTHFDYGDKKLTTVITFKNGTVPLLAEYARRYTAARCGYFSYKIEGVDVNSRELVFNFLPTSLPVSVGQEFHVWYGGDLIDCGEYNNSSQTCADVYAWYA